MQYIRVKSILDYPKSVLTISDLMRVLGLNRNSAIVTANRLVKQGVLIPLMRNKFVISLKPVDLLSLANEVYAPSYLSFETALNYHGIITQIPQPIFSATYRRPKSLIFQKQEFYYHHLDEDLFFGFKKMDNIIVGEKEKALLDQLYFFLLGKKWFSLDEMSLDEIDFVKLEEYAQNFPQRVRKKLPLIKRHALS